LYHIGAGDLKAVFMRVLGPSEKRVYHYSLFSALNALLVMDFDEGPSAEIKDFSGQGNNGIVMGNLKWVQGMFGKAVQTDASQGDYIRFPDSGSLAKTSQGTSLTMMAWIYPIDEQNFSDIISKGDWNCLQLKGSNHLIDFYTGGWEGHEAIASVPENWNRHWHHLAGVADGTDYRLYVDGKLAVIKKGELRDPHGETGTTDYSGSPWNIGRNASSPDRVFKGYIDDVMIFKKALNQQQVMSLMLHIY
jgi:hypothetical protein